MVKNLRLQELENLLVALGFEKRLGKGSHISFNHPQLMARITLSNHGLGQVVPVYLILQVQRGLNELKERTNDASL